MNNAVIEIMKLTTQEEINEAIGAIKLRQNQISRRNIRAFQVNDNVMFTSSRGGTIRGVVTKINRKTINVRVAGDIFSRGSTVYRVPASMLQFDVSQQDCA
jgi:transcription antitermination factor NusG